MAQPLTSVRSALLVLKVFTPEHQAWGVRELAGHLGWSHSRTHALLSTLASEGFLRQLPDRRYRLGQVIFELGGMFLSRLRGEALPVMHRLNEAMDPADGVEAGMGNEAGSIAGGGKLSPYVMVWHDRRGCARHRLARIRAVGVAYGHEEAAVGLSCVAVPIYDYSGEVVAALSMSLPTVHLPPVDQSLPRAVKEAASEISQALGYVPNVRGYRFSTLRE